MTAQVTADEHNGNHQQDHEAEVGEDESDRHEPEHQRQHHHDEASHQADWKTKVDAIEHIDKFVVGPVLDKLRTFPDWRILVMPDHPTNIATRKHGYAPTLFAIAGSNVKRTSPATYNEKNAAAGGLFIERGYELMEYFLRGGT